MAKQAAIQFDRSLHKLFDDRTHWLREQVRKPKPGKAPVFDKKKVERSIERLQALATKCLLRPHAIDGLKQLHEPKRQWRVKGFGNDQKRKTFVAWFEKSIPFKNCVYVFWRKRQCRYIGRTITGKHRIKNQMEKQLFNGVTRIDLYAARGMTDIPKLECLAIHRFQPTFNKNKSATQKRTKRCPICEAHQAIRSEVKSIFRLK